MADAKPHIQTKLCKIEVPQVVLGSADCDESLPVPIPGTWAECCELPQPLKRMTFAVPMGSQEGCILNIPLRDGSQLCKELPRELTAGDMALAFQRPDGRWANHPQTITLCISSASWCCGRPNGATTTAWWHQATFWGATWCGAWSFGGATNRGWRMAIEASGGTHRGSTHTSPDTDHPWALLGSIGLLEILLESVETWCWWLFDCECPFLWPVPGICNVRKLSCRTLPALARHQGCQDFCSWHIGPLLLRMGRREKVVCAVSSRNWSSLAGTWSAGGPLTKSRTYHRFTSRSD